MKKTLVAAVLVVMVVTACEKNPGVSDGDTFLKINNNIEYKFSDFDLYDSSTHILYFRTYHPEIKSESTASFTFSAFGEDIYQGQFLPGYSSSMPVGPFIYSFPFFYQNFALRIERWETGTPDPRNDARIIAALKEQSLLQSGLTAEISSVEITGMQMTFKFTVTNNDETDLLILDPVKTGTSLFHYFTNGLYLRDSENNEVFSPGIEPERPDPWDSWDISWLSVLKSGESRQFTINYTMVTPIPPGTYKALFEFPGLSFQVSHEQLYQGGNRIWLGDVQATAEINL